MKRFFSVVLVLALAVPSFAGFSVTPFGGYTTVAMSQMNKDLDGFKDYLTGTLWPNPDIKVIHHGSAINAGLDLGYSFIPGLTVGARVEYIKTLGGYVYLNSRGYIPFGDNIDFNWNAALVPVMAGVSYDMAVSKDLNAGLGLYAGYGFALTNFEFKSSYLQGYADYTGGGFTSDIVAKCSCKTGPVSLNLQLGYRLANIAKVTSPENQNSMFGPITKGATAKDNDGKDLAFDFSGLIANIGVTAAF